jgi:LDH2 family malate/lactate/ureidoglycolate dehydrogenase
VTPSPIRISADDLTSFLAALLGAKGMSATDARTLASVIAWADLRGISSHGVERAPMYLRIIDSGEMDPRAVPTLIDNAPALFTVDAHRSAGPVAMKMVTDEAMRRARTYGSTIGIARGTTHTGAIGHYVCKAAEQGFAAIHINSGPPNMAYHGAKVTSLATSPIAIGVPTREGPLVLDMATAMIANGRLEKAARDHEPIPAGAALTKDGEPTTDASKAAILLPLGGPKGSGLSFMIESLTSILAANPILLSAIAPGGKRRHVHNAMFIAIDIGKLRPLDDFKREMSAFGEIVKALPRLDPQAEILLPGERGAREEAARTKTGIPVPGNAWAKLVEAAEKLGVAVPQTLS